MTSLQKQARNQKNQLCKLIAQQKGGSSREGEFSLTTWGIQGLAIKPLRVTLQKQLQFFPYYKALVLIVLKNYIAKNTLKTILLKNFEILSKAKNSNMPF